MAWTAAALPFSIANIKKFEELKKARTKQEQSPSTKSKALNLAENGWVLRLLNCM